MSAPLPASFGKKQKSIYNATRAYLPEDHRDLVKWIDGKMEFADSSDPRWDMYGSILELGKQVRQFQAFRGGMTEFGAKLTEPINTVSEVLPGIMKTKFYIYKQDLFPILDSILDFTNEYIWRAVSFYFRTLEMNLVGKFDLIRYEEEKFVNLEKEIEERLSNEDEIVLMLKEVTPDELFEVLKTILPKNSSDPEYSAILEVVNDANEKLPIMKETQTFYEMIINEVSITVRSVNKLFDANPLWFDTSDSPFFIRIFSNIVRNFVLIHEVRKEMIRANMDLSCLDGDVPPLATMKLTELATRFGTQSERFECVPVNLIKSSHRGTRIPTKEGIFLISSTEVLRELFHEIISVKKLFQNISAVDARTILDILWKALDIKDTKEYTIFYLEDADKIRQTFFENLQQQLPHVMEKEKLDVRKVRPEGFTVEDLKNEMVYLGIVKTFPYILSWAPYVHGEIVKQHQKAREADVLRTCDMFSALELIQIIYIFSRCSLELSVFVHSSGECSAFNIHCFKCNQERREILPSENHGNDSLVENFESMDLEESEEEYL